MGLTNTSKIIDSKKRIFEVTTEKENGKPFTVDNIDYTDIVTFQYIRKHGNQHVIKRIKPSEYQLRMDAWIRNGKGSPLSVVETRWFKERKLDLKELRKKI